MNKIIAVDFDGTLFTNAWPEIGQPIYATIEALKEEQKAEAKIILWTNRVGERLQDAIEACESVGIRFDAVNDNLPEMVEAFGNNCRKVFANEYWDDRAVIATKDGISSEAIIWNKISTRPLTDEEREYYPEDTECMFDCALPDDGDEVLVQTAFGVATDIFCNDGEYGCGGENYDDWTEVIAWAKMPKGIGGQRNG